MCSRGVRPEARSARKSSSSAPVRIGAESSRSCRLNEPHYGVLLSLRGCIYTHVGRASSRNRRVLIRLILFATRSVSILELRHADCSFSLLVCSGRSPGSGRDAAHPSSSAAPVNQLRSQSRGLQNGALTVSQPQLRPTRALQPPVNNGGRASSGRRHRRGRAHALLSGEAGGQTRGLTLFSTARRRRRTGSARAATSRRT